MLNVRGSEWDPVILPVFKTGARHLRGAEGVFDSHTLPPISCTNHPCLRLLTATLDWRSSDAAALYILVK